jgi:hypothetical protein
VRVDAPTLNQPGTAARRSRFCHVTFDVIADAARLARFRYAVSSNLILPSYFFIPLKPGEPP